MALREGDREMISRGLQEDLQSKETLTLEEFKALGHARLKQLIQSEVVC